MALQKEIVGLVPAAGVATRLSPLPFSKELYPIGFRMMPDGQSLRAKAVCHYLLETMRVANITRVYIVLRGGKWDIPAYLSNGKNLKMHLAYLMMGLPYGVPFTVDEAYPFVKDAVVAFGFPDIIFQPQNAFVKLVAKQTQSNADLVLGLFPVEKPEKWDMVHLEKDGRIREIFIKPAKSDLLHTWIIAVWTPVFTRFIHELILAKKPEMAGDCFSRKDDEREELFMGEVIQAALQNGIYVESFLFSDGNCIDIGTVEDLRNAQQATNRLRENVL